LSLRRKSRIHPSAVSSRPRWALAALLLLAVGAFYALGLHRYLSWESLRSHLDTWLAAVQRNLPLALLVYLALYTAVTALSIPVATGLTLVGGALFGRWLGVAVVSFASTLGATLSFLTSRYLLRAAVQARFGGRLEAINRGIERDGAFYLFTLRLTPVVPFFLINLALGLTRMRAMTFATVSWLGMLPATVLYVNAGTALASLESPRDILSPTVVFSLLLLGIVPLSIRKLLQRRARS
jgi:uncharacterized membrane protein YdjX (TVP38/TMEM64 family)